MSTTVALPAFSTGPHVEATTGAGVLLGNVMVYTMSLATRAGMPVIKMAGSGEFKVSLIDYVLTLDWHTRAVVIVDVALGTRAEDLLAVSARVVAKEALGGIAFHISRKSESTLMYLFEGAISDIQRCNRTFYRLYGFTIDAADVISLKLTK